MSGSNAFTLTAQVLGNLMRLTATWSERGLVVEAPGLSRRATDLAGALSIARSHMGMFLCSAQQAQGCWGLHVSAGRICAAYGESPVPLGPPAPPTGRLSELARLHQKWRLDDGPRAALANALAIIELATDRQKRAA
jgi:hypothetical protein